jgi:hypothetical protein
MHAIKKPAYYQSALCTSGAQITNAHCISFGLWFLHYACSFMKPFSYNQYFYRMMIPVRVAYMRHCHCFLLIIGFLKSESSVYVFKRWKFGETAAYFKFCE